MNSGAGPAVQGGGWYAGCGTRPVTGPPGAGRSPTRARLLPETLLAPLPDVTLALYASDSGTQAAREPLLAHIIDLLQASPALAAA